jgi:hypothetical protein
VKRKIEKRHREIGTAEDGAFPPETKDRRLYLLSNFDPAKLALKYSLWSAAPSLSFWPWGSARPCLERGGKKRLTIAGDCQRGITAS